MRAQLLNRITQTLIPLSLGAVAFGAVFSFAALEAYLPQTKMIAHISVALGALSLVLSIIVQRHAHRQRESEDCTQIAPGARPPRIRPCESFAHECCLTGTHRL